MTKISKCLVVFTVAASAAFLGFVSATVVGGPNWGAESRELTGYVFQKTGDTATSWSVNSNAAGDTFSKSSLLLPEAVVEARKHSKSRHQEELKQLDADIPKVREELQQAQQLTEIDQKAIQLRFEQLTAELEALRKQINDVSEEGIQISQEAQATNQQLERRREDVLRLINQLAEIRTELFQAVEQQKRLRDEMIQIQGNIDPLKRREQQLLNAGGKLKASSTE